MQILQYEPINYPVNQNQPINIEVIVDTEDRQIQQAFVYFRKKGQSHFIQEPLITFDQSKFIGLIPGNFVQPDSIEYCIIFELNDFGVLSLPYYNPLLEPYRIVVKDSERQKLSINNIKSNQRAQKKDNKNNLIKKNNSVILSPIPNAKILSEELMIAVSYFDMVDLDTSKIELWIDNKNYTNILDISSDFLQSKSIELDNGKHEISIIMKDKYDQLFESIDWEFIVYEKEKKSLFKRYINQSFKYYINYSQNIIDTESQNITLQNINYSNDMDWLRINSKFFISSLQNNYQQNKNKYSFEFANDFMKLRIGSFSPTFDKYSINGNNINGVGFDFNTKYFSFSIINGNSLNAIQGEENNNAIFISKFYDPEGDIDGRLILDRSGYTFKQGIRGFNSYFGLPQKLMFKFNFLKIKDNTESVYKNLIDANIYVADSIQKVVENEFIINDSITYLNFKENFSSIYGNQYDYYLSEDDWSGAKPKDNIIIGTGLSTFLDKKHIHIDMGIQFSMLNQNIWDPILSKDNLDTLTALGDTLLDGKILENTNIPFDPLKYSGIFHMGINQVPLIPMDLSNENYLLFVRLTHLPSVVYYINSNFYYLGHKLHFGYEQIGPEYNSLVNPYLNKNIRQTTFSDNLILLDRKLFLSIKYRLINDGISLLDEAIKNYNKFDVNMGFYPGASLPTMNLSYGKYYYNNGISISENTSDSEGRVETVTNQLNIAITNSFKLIIPHNVSITMMSSAINDNVFDEKRKIESIYYDQSISISKESNNLSYGFGVRSKINPSWESNYYLGYSTYDYGNKNTNYYTNQSITSSDLIINKKFDIRLIENIATGFNITLGKGSVSFNQIGCKFKMKNKILNNFYLLTSINYRLKNVNNQIKNNFDFNTRLSFEI